MEKVFSFFRKIENSEWFYLLPEKMLYGMTEYDKDKLAGHLQTYLKYKNKGFSDEHIAAIMDYFVETCEKYLCELEEQYDIEGFSIKMPRNGWGKLTRKKECVDFVVK